MSIEIAKFKRQYDGNGWWVTEFTMDQIEKRIEYLEKENKKLIDKIVDLSKYVVIPSRNRI